MSTKGRWSNGFLEYYDSGSDDHIPAGASIYVYDDFTGPAIDTTNDWNFDSVNSGAVAYSSALGGVARVTTGAADNDDCEIATGLVFQAQYGCVMEARIADNDADKTCFCVGFTDAISEGADTLAITFDSNALVTTASDAAMLVHDHDYAGTSAYVQLVTVKADTDGTPVASTTTVADGVYHVYRVEIDTAGNVKGYIDGELVGTVSEAITTTDQLCAYVGFINHGEAAANTLDIDYIRAWGNRS